MFYMIFLKNHIFYDFKNNLLDLPRMCRNVTRVIELNMSIGIYLGIGQCY